jgi:hypothetical protein
MNYQSISIKIRLYFATRVNRYQRSPNCAHRKLTIRLQFSWMSEHDGELRSGQTGLFNPLNRLQFIMFILLPCEYNVNACKSIPYSVANITGKIYLYVVCSLKLIVQATHKDIMFLRLRKATSSEWFGNCIYVNMIFLLRKYWCVFVDI